MPSDDARGEAADALRAATKISLACHLNPDGDALGSMLGLALALEDMGKTVVRLCQDAVPPAYRFLHGADNVDKEPPKGWTPDIAISLDCDAEHRLGAVAPFIVGAAKVLDIDHHTGSGPFGDIRVLDPHASSTSQQVYELLAYMGVPLDRDVATCLLAGIIFDTGAFRFSNATPPAFTAAARLVEAGAEPNVIHRAMFEDKPFTNVKLLGRALSNAQMDAGVAWSALSRQDFRESGAEESETEGIVNNLMAVRDVKAAALFRETAHGVRVSLRGRNGVNVAEVARQFGGGGHVKAAGCTVNKPLDEAVSEVLTLLKG